MTRKEIKKQMDALARLYANTHDEKVKTELENLSWLLVLQDPFWTVDAQ